MKGNGGRALRATLAAVLVAGVAAGENAAGSAEQTQLMLARFAARLAMQAYAEASGTAQAPVPEDPTIVAQAASPNAAEVAGKAGATNVIVLAFCFSQQWFNNIAPQGNNGKL